MAEEQASSVFGGTESQLERPHNREVTESPDTSEVLDPVPENVQAKASRQQKEQDRRNALTKYLEQKATKAAVRDINQSNQGFYLLRKAQEQKFSFVLDSTKWRTKPLTVPSTPAVLKRPSNKKNTALNNFGQDGVRHVTLETVNQPLPGLHRIVLGQTNTVNSTNSNLSAGEALPPPGLHRMVTGQGTESISLRSVLGQPSSISHSNDSGFVRLVPGQQTPRDSPEPSSLERLIPGQQNNEDVISQRMVPGHYSQDSRFSSYQISQDELHRLIPGQVESEPPIGARMILGQQSDDENNISANEMDRMIPGEVSEHDNSFPGDVLDDERMVPGGMSDDLRSQSISIDDEARNSSERKIPGINETHQLQLDNTTERLVTGGGRTEVDDISNPSSGQDGVRHVTLETVNQPLPGLHRIVLGQTNTVNSTNSNLSAGEQPRRSPRLENRTPKNVCSYCFPDCNNKGKPTSRTMSDSDS